MGTSLQFSATRVRVLLPVVTLAMLAALLLDGDGLRALFDGNMGHLAVLKAQLSHDASEQQRLLDRAESSLANSPMGDVDDLAYTRTQLALAPVVGCPQPSGGALKSATLALGESRAQELAMWIESNSVIPVCLRVGNLDSAAVYYAWVQDHLMGMTARFRRLPTQLASAFVGRAFSRYEAADAGGAQSDWAKARGFLASSSYETFGDLVEKVVGDHRAAQQRLLAIDAANEPENRVARVYLAQAYNLAGQGQKALDAISPLLDKMPRDTRVWQQYGQALISLRRLPEAEAALRRAVELAPGDLGALNRLGVFYLATGKPQQAEPLFRKALAAPGGEAAYWVWEHLGDALLAEGRQEEAADAYRAAINAAPPELAASARGKLERLAP